jgi:hypothetical protein
LISDCWRFGYSTHSSVTEFSFRAEDCPRTRTEHRQVLRAKLKALCEGRRRAEESAHLEEEVKTARLVRMLPCLQPQVKQIARRGRGSV